MKYFTL